MLRGVSTLALGAFLIAGCDGRLASPDSETSGQCAERFDKAGFDQVVPSEALFPDQRVEPTYIYNLSALDTDATVALMKDAGMDQELVVVSGNPDRALEQFMKPSEKRYAFFNGEKVSLYKVREAPMFQSEVVHAGCRLTDDGMRLISIHQRILPRQNPSTVPTDPET